MELAMEDAPGEAGLARPGLRADDDYLTVTMLAAGLAGILARRPGNGGGARRSDGLLPAAWRAGYSRLWWRCQEQGVRAPDSDLDLLAWCASPFAAWPVELSLSAQDMQSCLVVGEELSGFAEQGARLAGADVEAEWTENRVYQALRTAALASGGDDDAEAERVYAVLRRRLIDHPVLTDLELKQWEREFALTDGSGQTYVRRLVDEAYVPRPAPGTYQYFRCPGCGNTVPDAGSPCGTAGCLADPAGEVSVPALAVVYEQHRATRRFIHDPGLVEARLLDALASQELAGRVRVTAYPGLDALDLLVEFLKNDGARVEVAETWGADAKDQESARLLARAFSWPGSPRCDRRFLVLPEHRAGQPGYVEDLRAELDGRMAGIEVVAEKRLISMVRAAARTAAR